MRSPLSSARWQCDGCRRKGAGSARLILVAYLEINQMLAVFNVRSGYRTVDSIGVANQVGMAHMGHEFLQGPVVSHPVSRHLHQPAHALWSIVELPRHAPLTLDSIAVEALQ